MNKQIGSSWFLKMCPKQRMWMAIPLYNRKLIRNWILLSITLLRCYNFRPTSLLLSLFLNPTTVFLFKWAVSISLFFSYWAHGRFILANHSILSRSSIFSYAMLCDNSLFYLYFKKKFYFYCVFNFCLDDKKI